MTSPSAPTQPLKIFRETTLPGLLEAYSIYMIAPTGAENSDYVEMYVTDSMGNARRIVNRNDINLLISDALASVNQITIVADITPRDAFIAPGTTEATPKYVFVIDATADNRVTSGGATYLYNNDPAVKNWILVSMANDMDMAVSWENLSGKPSSSPSDIDNAVSLRHSHANKTQLDKIGEDANGLLTYDGVLPLTGWQSTSW